MSWDFLLKEADFAHYIKSLLQFSCLYLNCKLSITLDVICILWFAPATPHAVLRKFCLGKIRHKGSTHRKYAIKRESHKSVWIRLRSQEVLNAAKCPVKKKSPQIFVLICTRLRII